MALLAFVACGTANPPQQETTFTLSITADGGRASGGGDYAVGTVVVLTATADQDSVFVGWFDGTTRLSANTTYSYTVSSADKTITAKFAIKRSVTVTTEGNGRASGGGDYGEGTEVSLTATAKQGSMFVGWYDGDVLVSENARYKFVITHDSALVAHFVDVINVSVYCSSTGNSSLTQTLYNIYCSAQQPYILPAPNINTVGKEVLDDIITDNMTAFEKERAIYQWMMDQHNSGLNSPDINDPDANQRTKTAYGFLNGYAGDCMGWSGTFYTLCNMACVKCFTVDAQAQAGGAKNNFQADHRFNMVVLDGEAYFVEIFWFYQKLSASEGDWRYFNMTSQQAALSHTWADESICGFPTLDFTTY